MSSEVSFLVRTDGPDQLSWGGVGPASIGIVELPRGVAIRVKPIAFRSPSAEGSSKLAGSKAANVKLGKKTAGEIINEIKCEFPNLTWHSFETREEAVAFCTTGKTDWEVLGVDRGATANEIRSAYLAKSREHHPDLGGDIAQFQALAAAYKRITHHLAAALS